MSKARKLAIIPARGGSKRIPRKNIRAFRGKPIIAWSIEAALKSDLFDDVMVSTDDAEIADIAREYGAAVPFLRSAKASDDFATTPDVLLEVLGCYAQQDQHYDLGCCIHPTAPFVMPKMLSAGMLLLDEGAFDTVFPVAKFDYPIWRSLNRSERGVVQMNFPENLNARSQDLPPAFHDAGQWYWFRVQAFLREKVLMGTQTGAIELPATHVQDIDTLDDWTIAEFKHEWMMRDG